MSIDIDRKKLRIAEPQVNPISPYLDFIRAFPTSVFRYAPPDIETSYDGEWIKFIVTKSGIYPVLGQAGFSFYRATTGLETRLIGGVRVKAPPDDSWIFFFFFEPTKGDFANYQGFDTKGGTTHYARSRLTGNETATNLDPQDWTVERAFTIIMDALGEYVDFYVDNELKAHHTTNVHAPPTDMLFLEPDGKARTMYLRYPYGLCVG